MKRRRAPGCGAARVHVCLAGARCDPAGAMTRAQADMLFPGLS